MGLSFLAHLFDKRRLNIHSQRILLKETPLAWDVIEPLLDKTRSEFELSYNMNTLKSEIECISEIAHIVSGSLKGNPRQTKRFLNTFYANMCSTVKGRSIITRIPFNRLLIESDGPFSKVLGRRYMPSMLSDLYSVVGNAVGCENLEYIVWENFKALLTR